MDEQETINQYSVRDDVQLVSVCGVHLLVATREALTACPAVKQLSRGGAFVWALMQKHTRLEHIEQILTVMQRRPQSDVHQNLYHLLHKMQESGYLTLNIPPSAQEASPVAE